jgi:hypothetical protein
VAELRAADRIAVAEAEAALAVADQHAGAAGASQRIALEVDQVPVLMVHRMHVAQMPDAGHRLRRRLRVRHHLVGDHRPGARVGSMPFDAQRAGPHVAHRRAEAEPPAPVVAHARRRHLELTGRLLIEIRKQRDVRRGGARRDAPERERGEGGDEESGATQ